MPNRITVLIADDHDVVRAGIRMLLEREQDIEVVGTAATGREAVRLSHELRPNIVLMDISMPDLNGFDATRQIIDELPGVRILVLTMHVNPSMANKMLKAGASGYMTKSSAADQLVPAIRSVNDGKVFISSEIERVLSAERMALRSPDLLTSREREVLQLLAEGRTSYEIAQKLSLSVKTVSTYRMRISDKLGLSSMAELTRYAIREGLTSL